VRLHRGARSPARERSAEHTAATTAIVLGALATIGGIAALVEQTL
jgi:hypothetical protein